VFIYNELLIFSALVGIYIYVLLYAVYGQSPSIMNFYLFISWKETEDKVKHVIEYV